MEKPPGGQARGALDRCFTLAEPRNWFDVSRSPSNNPNNAISGEPSYAPDFVTAQLYLEIIHEDQPTELRALWGNAWQRPEGWPKSISLSSNQSDLHERLSELNTQGYDIFAVANQIDPAHATTGKATKDRHIVGINVVWVDIDHESISVDLTNLGRLEQFKCPPSLIVQTSEPHRLQAYWIIDDEVSLEGCKAINRALAVKLGGDSQATNVSRILRVPGFRHHKSKLQSQIVGGTFHGYKSTVLREEVEVRAGKAKAPREGYIVSVLDALRHVVDSLNEEQKKRLLKMRQGHARERAADKQTSPIKLARGASPRLPSGLAQSLRNCETPEAFIQTLVDLWPRRPGHRHALTLVVSTDLYRFDFTLSQACKIISKACAKAHDDELQDRLKAVADTYRKIQQGQRVTGAGAGAAMTVFDAKHWGPDLRTLPSAERPVEAERRVLTVLNDIRETDAGVKPCSCRTLAERTGIGKNTISSTLVRLEAEGIIKRVQSGIVMRAVDQDQALPEVSEPNNPDYPDLTPSRGPDTPAQPAYNPLPYPINIRRPPRLGTSPGGGRSDTG